MFAGNAGAETGEGGAGSGALRDDPTKLATVTEALNAAKASFAQADEALKTGDLAAYQRAIDEARKYVEEAATAEGR